MFQKCLHSRYLHEFMFQISVGEFLRSADPTLTRPGVAAADDVRDGADTGAQSQTLLEPQLTSPPDPADGYGVSAVTAAFFFY